MDNSHYPVENFLWITAPDPVENFMWITIGILLKSLWKSYPQPGIPAGLSTGPGARATHPLPHPQYKKDHLCSPVLKKAEKTKKEKSKDSGPGWIGAYLLVLWGIRLKWDCP